MSKHSLWLEPVYEATEEEWMYTVVRAKNLTDPMVGSNLTKQQVDKLIRMSVDITIQLKNAGRKGKS